MFHGGKKGFTELGIYFTGVLNNSRRGVKISQRYQTIHGGG